MLVSIYILSFSPIVYFLSRAQTPVVRAGHDPNSSEAAHFCMFDRLTVAIIRKPAEVKDRPVPVKYYHFYVVHDDDLIYDLLRSTSIRKGE